jgi:hypothetical protein
VLPVGSRVFQFDQTHTKNLAAPISELQSLDGLLSRVKEWEVETARRRSSRSTPEGGLTPP